MIRSIVLPLVLALVSSFDMLRAAAPCCDGCGCQPCTRKICRLVREEKEVTKKVYSCKCEDFCIPGRSIRCKAPCDCTWWCSLCCDHSTYKPTCGCVRTRVVPVISTETKKVPSYKCVVEEVCTRCGHCANRVDYPSTDDPATAMAMAEEADINSVASTEATESAAAEATVAGRRFFDRVFVRK